MNLIIVKHYVFVNCSLHVYSEVNKVLKKYADANLIKDEKSSYLIDPNFSDLNHRVYLIPTKTHCDIVIETLNIIDN